MPMSVEAEAAILGSILLKNSHYREAAAHLCAGDFSLESHQRLFTRMGDLLGQGKAVDIVTLPEELKRSKELNSIGGIAYLADLTEGLPGVSPLMITSAS